MVTEFKRIQHLRGTFAEWSMSPGDGVAPLAAEIAVAFMAGGGAPNAARLFVGDGSFAMNAGVPLSVPEVRTVGADHGSIFIPTSKLAGLTVCWGQEAENLAPNFTVVYPSAVVYTVEPIVLLQYREVADVSCIARISGAPSVTGFGASILDLGGTPIASGEARLNWIVIGTSLNPGYET